VRQHRRDAAFRFYGRAVIELGFPVFLMNGVVGLHLDGAQRLGARNRGIAQIKRDEAKNHAQSDTDHHTVYFNAGTFSRSAESLVNRRNA